jgi:protein phosphatase
VASELAVSKIQELFSAYPDLPDSPREVLHQGLMTAHQAIAKEGKQPISRKGMGTTAVLVWVLEDRLEVVWSGDSRAYVLNAQKELQLISQDHSLVWDLVKKGEISAEEARIHPQSNIITQSLGDENYPPDPEGIQVPVEGEARILLCSDGLNGMLPDSQIRAILASEDAPGIVASRLIQAANGAGGEDNITVIVADLMPLPDDNSGNESIDSMNAPEEIGDAAESPQEEKEIIASEAVSPLTQKGNPLGIHDTHQQLENTYAGLSKIGMYIGAVLIVALLLFLALK